MAPCVKCENQNAAYPFRVLEVQTLHIRDLAGERRVQALGGIREYGVCPRCAKARLDAFLLPWGNLAKRLLPFLCLLVVGGGVSVFFRDGSRYLRWFGLGALVCGAAVIWDSVRLAFRERREYASLPPDEALEKAAWACLTEHAPKKHGDNDLTYIPMGEKTKALDPAALAQRYDLLPAIAAKALERIRGADAPAPGCMK